MKTKIFTDNAQTRPVGQRMLTAVRKAAVTALEFVEISLPCEINIRFVSPDEIKQLNRDFRAFDEETDVLSFPSGEYNTKNEPKLKKNERLFLGDIAICVEIAYKQAKTTPKDELMLLTAHSVLHLLGYDHKTKKEERNMFGKQEEIVKLAKTVL